MRSIKLFQAFFPVIFPAVFLLTGCSGATGSNGSKDSGVVAVSNSGSSDGGDAHYSATIDGKPYSGSDNNRASRVSLQENTTIDGLSFQLGRVNGQKQGFDFVISNNGTTHLKQAQIRTVCNYHSPEGVTYIDDTATVTISVISSSRVSGVFSGRFINAHYGNPPGNWPEAIQITEGKFDLPF
ncbi:MAG TPA: hypothetical protein VK563_22920 [Puia sp.]|nr:hypothetical protein [Puia sp.]